MIPVFLLAIWNTERSSDLAGVTQLASLVERIFIPGLSNLEVPVLSSVTYGFTLTKKLSSQYKQSKGEVAKRLASFQQLLHGQMTKNDEHCGVR